MGRKFLFILLVIFSSSDISAQFTRYIVKFTDKNGTPFSINDPSKYLSQKAISRREKQKIAIDETDLPVNPAYIDSVRSVRNVVVLDESKWLNQICIATTDPAALQKINGFPFVTTTEPVKRLASIFERKNKNERINKNKFTEQIKNIASPLSPQPGSYYSYGNSFTQINIHNGEYLHNQGFHGEGMLIAILDAGFYHYQSLPAFDSVNLKKLVIDTHDFVDNEASVNEDDAHGMMCFSIIAANIPDHLVGSAPNASFLLYRSEDVSSESPVEEQYWIAAAERADSAGADIISTSLGYNEFDNAVFNYTYADMNGHTSMIAKAATLASKKGMIVMAAAGNEGDDSWHYITTPADADSILSVAAVDGNGNVANFSSFGPASDGRITPTSASVGAGTALSSVTGSIESGNGTSFATPNLAGLVTCLWQAFPDFTNIEIISAIEKSSSIYNAPDNRIGYGIPDFKKAFDYLGEQRLLKNASEILADQYLKVFPNPYQQNFTVLIKPKLTAAATFQLYDASGRLCYKTETSLTQSIPLVIHFTNLPALQKGLYLLKFNDGKNKQTFKVIKE